MYLSWRSTNSIAFVEGVDGVHWSEPVIVLSPDFTTGWEDDINRQIVLEKDGKYLMWYTGMKFLGAGERMSSGRSCIGYAESDDGIHFTRRKDPVMEPEEAWEKNQPDVPSCIVGMKNGKFLECGIRQEVSGEPDQIGYAESEDGIHWKKHPQNPIFRPEPTHFWEKEIVSACQIFPMDGYYYMFYIGFEDMYKSDDQRCKIKRWNRRMGTVSA